MKSTTLIATCLTFLSGATSLHAAEIRTVALSGQQAPGTPDGVNYSGFWLPVLNDAGQTAFQANLTGSGVDFTNDDGIWSEGSGSLALVARAGNQAPGTPSGNNFIVLRSPVINDAGQTAFYGGLRPGFNGVNGANDNGIWSEGSGSLALVVRDGDQAPGTSSGVSYSSIYEDSIALNNAGRTSFFASLTLTDGGVNSTNNLGIWSDGSGSLALVARHGDQVPGTPSGVVYQFHVTIRHPALNDAGQTAFWPRFAGDSGIGIWSEGSLALVARTGDQAPGMPSGVNFSSAGNDWIALNEAGQTVFLARLNDDRSGIWSEGSGSMALVTSAGEQAPGAPSGVNFNGFNLPVLNNAGQTAFIATSLAGNGLDPTNDSGIWSEGSGSLTLVAREGDHAPGTPDGVLFRPYFFVSTNGSLGTRLVLNDAGQTAFYTELTGAGVDSSNNFGFWATDRSGQLQLIARMGDLLEVAPGEFRTISALSCFTCTKSTGNSDGRSVSSTTAASSRSGRNSRTARPASSSPTASPSRSQARCCWLRWLAWDFCGGGEV